MLPDLAAGNTGAPKASTDGALQIVVDDDVAASIVSMAAVAILDDDGRLRLRLVFEWLVLLMVLCLPLL